MQAESLTFLLARQMPRTEVQQIVAALCRDALRDGEDLITLARARFPDANLIAPGGWPDLGKAPQEARAFADRVRAL